MSYMNIWIHANLVYISIIEMAIIHLDFYMKSRYFVREVY